MSKYTKVRHECIAFKHWHILFHRDTVKFSYMLYWPQYFLDAITLFLCMMSLNCEVIDNMQSRVKNKVQTLLNDD